MKDLSNAVAGAMAEMIKDGSVEEIIKIKLKKTVDDIIDDQLRSYSDFGKALKEKIHGDLKVNLENVTFAEYNKTIITLVEGIVNKAVTEDARGKLAADLEKLFKAPPKEIKLSEIVTMYVGEQGDDFDPDRGEYVGLIIEKRGHRSVMVGLNPKNMKRGKSYGTPDVEIETWQDCDLCMSFYMDKENEGVGALSHSYDRTGLSPHQFMPTAMSGVARLMYQLYCAGSKIIFDDGFEAGDYDTSLPDQY